MEVIIRSDADSAATLVTRLLARRLCDKPNLVLGLATGRTMLARGAPTVSLLGGLAAPIRPYLPSDVRAALSEPQGDALDGALLMVHRQFQEAKG